MKMKFTGTTLLCTWLLALLATRPATAATKLTKRDDFPSGGNGGGARFASSTVQPLTADLPVFEAAAPGRRSDVGRSLSRTQADANIVNRIDQRSPDGSYRYEYLTDNGIHRQETSQQIGFDRIVRGSYSYIGPDNQIYTVNYVADRNGYRAYGAHLPTQPDAVANIINQQPQPPSQQGPTSTAPQTFGFVPSSTGRPIYQRPTGRPQYVTSTTSGTPFTIVSAGPTFVPSTTLAPPSSFTVSPGAQGFGFGFGSSLNPTSTTQFPPFDFDNRNQLGINNLFGGNRPSFSSSSSSASPNSFSIVEVTTPSPFDNSGPIVHITPAPLQQQQQTFFTNRFPTQQPQQFGGFQLGNGNGNGNGIADGGGLFNSNAFFANADNSGGLSNNAGVFQQRYPTAPPSTSFALTGAGADTFTAFQQQLPFVQQQQFGQFNRDEYPTVRRAAANVQPLSGGVGGGGVVTSLEPSAFDRVVRRG